MDSNTTEDFDQTGTVTMISANQCAVSVNIDGTPETLSFGKRALYFWGNQCEGDMANLLEENMEVGVTYKFSESKDKTFIVAVWIGEKPDLSTTPDFLEAVYNNEGRVCRILDNIGFVVHCEKLPYNILVTREIVYRDGSPNKIDLALDEVITFDAIPMECKDDSGAMYEATCAWIGKVPRIVARFGLNIKERGFGTQETKRVFKYFQKKCVEATVAVIPNEVVAFVDVDHEGSIEEAMLFRGSFQEKSCESLKDIVNVGDRIFVVLGIGSIFGGCIRLYAVKAWKNRAEVDESESSSEEFFDSISHSLVSVEMGQPLSSGSSTSTKNSSGVLNNAVENLTPDFNTRNVLYMDPPLRGVLRPFPVVKGMKKESLKTVALITSPGLPGLTVLVKMCNFYINGSFRHVTPDAFQSLVRSESTVVNFEGVVNRHPNKKLAKCGKYSHVATCVWTGRKPSLSVIQSRFFPVAPITEKTKNKSFDGTVVRFYLPDKAIVVLLRLSKSVCLHLDSFSCRQQAISGTHNIADFVQLDQHIRFNLADDPKCEVPVRAVNVQIIK